VNESSDLSRFRLHRRQFLTAFGLSGLGVGLGVLAACAPSAPPAAAPTAAAAKPAATTAPAAAAPTAAPAKPAATTAPAQAAPTTAPVAAATGALKPVPRNQTLITMQGGANGSNPAAEARNIPVNDHAHKFPCGSSYARSTPGTPGTP